jgi:regulator of protease activity HflC (stomatin/prohibitin superfamily)
MFGYQRIVIAQYERGLLFKNRSFQKILEPGVYRFFDPLRRITVENHDLSNPEFEHRIVDFLLQQQKTLCEQYFYVAELGERELGLVYKHDKLADVLAPGKRQLYWKGPVPVRVEPVNITNDYRIADPLIGLLIKLQQKQPVNLKDSFYVCEIADHQTGLLFVDGKLKQQLEPGRHAFWRFQRSLNVELIDLRLQTLEVSGQEILSKDKVSLRINLAAAYRVTDVVKARTLLANYKDYLYRELQFALRQVIGTRTLDELLGDKDQLDQVIFAQIAGRLPEYGLEVSSVGVKDVILPGDMKDILNQVVETEKVAQANIIKRREETAATRSLLNTAKLMDENPTLLRLKELEMLEKVTGKIDKLTVFGGLDGVLNELVRIRPPA